MALDPDYRVDLSVYSGPMDLLLYLIREREMNIHDIPISAITEQFLAHLEVIKSVDIDRAGDFLLMAATLMLIKSRMLLPRTDQDSTDGDDDLDPRTDLVQQLLEYKRFKDLSRALAGAEALRERSWPGGLTPPDSGALDAGKLLEELGVDDLLLAFERLMRETLAGIDHEVFGVDLPLREVSDSILLRLQGASDAVPFVDFFLDRRDRYYIVSVFLSLLELLRGKRIEIETGDNIADLKIRLAAEPAVPAENRVSGHLDPGAP